MSGGQWGQVRTEAICEHLENIPVRKALIWSYTVRHFKEFKAVWSNRGHSLNNYCDTCFNTHSYMYRVTFSHFLRAIYSGNNYYDTCVLLSHAFLELYAQRMLILCLKDMRACLVIAVCDDPKNTYSHFNELNYLKNLRTTLMCTLQFDILAEAIRVSCSCSQSNLHGQPFQNSALWENPLCAKGGKHFPHATSYCATLLADIRRCLAMSF